MHKTQSTCMVLPMVRVLFSLTCLSQFSECAHDNQELFHLEPKKNSNLMKIDGSSVRVTLTLKTNGYFVQLLHVISIGFRKTFNNKN